MTSNQTAEGDTMTDGMPRIQLQSVEHPFSCSNCYCGEGEKAQHVNRGMIVVLFL